MRATGARVGAGTNVRIVRTALITIAIATTATSTAAAARVLNVRDEGRLHFITSFGSELVDEGSFTGTVPGEVRTHFVYDGNPSVTAQFTIYCHGGSISGRGRARLNNPTSLDPSFRGTFSITAGSGRYRHIGGVGEFFGVFARRGYGLVVQTIGKLHY
jgi:hypothetical protein